VVGFRQKAYPGNFIRTKGNVLGRFPVVPPAFIDAHSHFGIIRAGESKTESESNEHQESILALSDVLDSVQMDDPSFQDAVERGILYCWNRDLFHLTSYPETVYGKEQLFFKNKERGNVHE
jgi:hypothetical protein